MAPAAKRQTTTAKQLGWRHRQAVVGLRNSHRDGSPCEWCGRPMWLDRTKNWDHKPSGAVTSGVLQGDHGKMSRSEALRRGLPVPLADRLLHGRCNIQRGEGSNDHLAASASRQGIDTSTLLMEWP
jgi:hypothetical protein